MEAGVVPTVGETWLQAVNDSAAGVLTRRLKEA